MERRIFLKISAGAIAAMTAKPAFAQQPQKPNIVYILADDLGFGDITCQNPRSKYPTHNLDRLAQQGCRFTDTHTNSAVCTPTRYGILTGRYAWRSPLKEDVLDGMSLPLIPPDRLTVASLLKQNGYYTACIGKWHLGLEIPKKLRRPDAEKPVTSGPIDLGFDTFFGIPASLDFPPYMYIHDRKIVQAPTERIDEKEFGRPGYKSPLLKAKDVLPELTARACAVIRDHPNNHPEKPLFLYFALTAPHTPVTPSNRFKGKTDSPYGDFILQVDDTVGQIMKTLHAAGLSENTLLIFTSDNGASPNAAASAIQKGHQPNKPWRGGKSLNFDGGHRVPFFVRWPGKTEPASTCTELYCTTDLIATCADIIDAKLPDNAAEDSVSMLPAMLGRSTEQAQRRYIIHHSISGQFAIRRGKYKLIASQTGGGWDDKNLGLPILPVDESAPGQLYDIEKDPYETINLYNHPQFQTNQKHPDHETILSRAKCRNFSITA